MKKNVTLLAFVLAVCGHAIAPNLVLADNVLPPVEDEYRLLCDDWKIEHKDTGPLEESYSVVCHHNGKSYGWPVDFQFQFASLKHDASTGQDVNQLVVNHIRETEQTNSFGPLVVKLASYKRGGTLFVRDLDIFNAYDAWKKACKFGSPMLGMDSGGIKRLGLDKYKRRCISVSDKDWQALTQRQ